LNCPEDSPIFIDCLRSKNKHDGLITQVLANLYYPSRNHYMNYIPEMVSEYNALEQMPELALNVCLEELQLDFEGTLGKICNFIGICGDVKKLASFIREECKGGGCRISGYMEKNYECRQTRYSRSECPSMKSFTPLFEDRNPFECLRKCKGLKETCRTILENKKLTCKVYNETCEKVERAKINPKSSVISQTCYYLPDFEVADIGDLIASLEGRPLLKQQLEALSMQMKCGREEKSYYIMSLKIPNDASVAVIFMVSFIVSTLLFFGVRKQRVCSYKIVV